MDNREILRPLLDEILEISAKPEQAVKMDLWARHQALEDAGRIPISVYWEGIPAPSWEPMLGKSPLQCDEPVAREIEYYLRRVLWMARNVDDDHIVWPLVRLAVPYQIVTGWGFDMAMHDSADELGAKAFAAPMREAYRLDRLTRPEVEVDEAAWKFKKERFEELTEGRVGLSASYPSPGHSPFDLAAQLRGLEEIMMDPVEEGESLHALMDFLTESYLSQHRRREEKGWINFTPAPDGIHQAVFDHRVHCARLPPSWSPGEPARLSWEWPYVSAQTSSGFGPGMYGEFVQPYHERLARLAPEDTVYYHGCEPLDLKMEIIRTLPHLRRFHVSPWSSLPKAVECFGRRTVLEAHAHPTRVFFDWEEAGIRENIRTLVRQGAGSLMDLNLSDIHTVNGQPEKLALWARVAREETARAS